LRIDGKNISHSTTSSSQSPRSYSGFNMGTDSDGYNDFEGYLDEFFVYDRYLSDADVDAIYLATKTGKISENVVFQNRTVSDGMYIWNVKATDSHDQVGWQSTNNTFFAGISAPDIKTIMGSSDSWSWGNPFIESGDVISGSSDSWTWREYEYGSGRKIPNGTFESWKWIDE